MAPTHRLRALAGKPTGPKTSSFVRELAACGSTVSVGRGRPMSRSAKCAAERSNDLGQVVSEVTARGAQILEGCCLFDDANGSKKEGRGVGWWADCMKEERRLRERRRKGGGWRVKDEEENGRFYRTET
jgi:hypothetical protein